MVGSYLTVQSDGPYLYAMGYPKFLCAFYFPSFDIPLWIESDISLFDIPLWIEFDIPL